jgi:hypothetical protein
MRLAVRLPRRPIVRLSVGIGLFLVAPNAWAQQSAGLPQERETMSAKLAIPEHVLACYVERYPHLCHLADNVRVGGRRTTVDFARVACRLSTPSGVTAREIYHLVGVAELRPWPADAPLCP